VFGAVTFQVEEFIPDRMKVDLVVGGVTSDEADAPPRVSPGATGALAAELQADYLFGRPVAKRPGKLVARVDPATFRRRGGTGGRSATPRPPPGRSARNSRSAGVASCRWSSWTTPGTRGGTWTWRS
jgi:hypothetical protein